MNIEPANPSVHEAAHASVAEPVLTEPAETYTLTCEYKCPTDASKVTHTLLYRQATCTRVDDLLMHFRCSRDSACVKCQQNYL